MADLLRNIERELNRKHRTKAQIWTRRITWAVFIMGIPLVGGELLLRVTGYRRMLIDEQAQEKTLVGAVDVLNKRFETEVFERDPWLLWKMKPGENLYGLTVGENGLLQNNYTPPKTSLRTRPLTVLVMGDSVSAITYKTYPETAERLANAAESGPAIRIINGAVPGYTTEQALRLFPNLKGLGPDVVMLCFGWNDHFPALNLPDRELGISNPGSRLLHRIFKDVRLYQFMGEPLGNKSSRRKKAEAEEVPVGNELRVDPVQFRSNLLDLVQMVRESGALPVLATQPHNLTEESMEFLRANNFVLSEKSDMSRLHRQYNDIVRRVAEENKVPLMDLEEEFFRRKREFMLEPDGIHLTPRGHNHIARLLLGLLRDEQKLTRADYDAMAKAEKHDSIAPDKPYAAWSLVPEHIQTSPGADFRFSVIAQNAGNTRWLRKHVVPRFGQRKNVEYGNVSVVAEWRTLDSPTTGIVAAKEVPSDIITGESTSVTLALKAPEKPGNYELEVGLNAAEVGLMKYFGAETTTMTVTVKP